VYRVSAALGPGINFGPDALAVLGWNSFAFGPWLRVPLGARHDDYRARVPRYLGIRRARTPRRS
jgi:hypothetical protein